MLEQRIMTTAAAKSNDIAHNGSVNESSSEDLKSPQYVNLLQNAQSRATDLQTQLDSARESINDLIAEIEVLHIALPHKFQCSILIFMFISLQRA
jgi:TolA-binding protein